MKATKQDFPVQFPVVLLVFQKKSENFSVLKFVTWGINKTL